MNNLNVISEKVAAAIVDHITANGAALTFSEIEQTSRTLLQEIGRQAIIQVAQAVETAYPVPVQCEKGHPMTYQRLRSARLHTV